MHIYRSKLEPNRENPSHEERWRQADQGLIMCWERGREIANSRNPELSQLARKFLATPAKTVPCERLFSMAGHLINKRRSTLSPEHANELLCLQNWLK